MTSIFLWIAQIFHYIWKAASIIIMILSWTATSINAHLRKSIWKWTKENLWKTAFKKFEGVSSALGRPYPFKFFKGCLPQILLGPFLNNLTQLCLNIWTNVTSVIIPEHKSMKKCSRFLKNVPGTPFCFKILLGI